MRSHELARVLLSVSDRKIVASVDMSTCDEDASIRVFGEFCGINDINDIGEIVLLFENGESNYDK